MGKVTSGLTMSLDGFIAGPNDGPEHPLGEGGMRLFDWYSSGDTDYVVPSGVMTFKVSSQAAELLREVFSEIGAIVTGRRTFDITNGWGGTHPIGEHVPIFVVTHSVPDGWGLRRVAVHLRHRRRGERGRTGQGGGWREERRGGRCEPRPAVPQGGDT